MKYSLRALALALFLCLPVAAGEVNIPAGAPTPTPQGVTKADESADSMLLADFVVFALRLISLT